MILKDFELSSESKIEFVHITAGSFTMGSPKGELGCQMQDETQHSVTITQDFWMGKYPVTQLQYETVMGYNPSSFKTGGDHPVETVSWYDAMAFCDRLTEMFEDQLPEAYRFYLPTEAQWEYSCRAGSASSLYTGEDLTSSQGPCPNLDPIAWYVCNHPDNGHLPVGLKEPNAFGLYDTVSMDAITAAETPRNSE